MPVVRNVSVALSGTAKLVSLTAECSNVTLTNVTPTFNVLYLYFRTPGASEFSVSASKYHYRLNPGDAMTVSDPSEIELFAATASVEVCYRLEAGS
jgi:hypothetical protein